MSGAGAAASDEPAISVESLVKAYGGRRVVDRVSFEVHRGEVVALLGPNGAGKTTTVEIIEGYRRADLGRVEILGEAPGGAGRDARARVGLMLQGGGGVDPRLTPLEVLGLHASLYTAAREPAELLAVVGLDGAAHTRFRRLSGGERQRLGVALAMVGRPDVLILDEPTAGMDVEGRSLMRDVIAGMRDEGGAVLLTSHDLVDVERVADRIVVLHRGRVAATGTVDSLRAGSPRQLTVRLDGGAAPADRADLAAAIGAEVTVGGDGRLRIESGAVTPELVSAIAAWAAARGVLIADLRTGGGTTLEERYLELVGDVPEAPR